MRKIIAVSMGLLCLILLVSKAGIADDKQQYIEPGRYGVEGVISSNGFQVGLVRETDNYELALDLDSFTSNSAGVRSGDLGVEARAGYRWNIGSFNYISAGANAQSSLFSKTSGQESNGSYLIGPYIGLQRHFSGTNLMLQLYVLPVNYNYSPAFAGASSTQTWQFFEQGGFGIAYLF